MFLDLELEGTMGRRTAGCDSISARTTSVKEGRVGAAPDLDGAGIDGLMGSGLSGGIIECEGEIASVAWGREVDGMGDGKRADVRFSNERCRLCSIVATELLMGSIAQKDVNL